MGICSTKHNHQRKHTSHMSLRPTDEADTQEKQTKAAQLHQIPIVFQADAKADSSDPIAFNVSHIREESLNLSKEKIQDLYRVNHGIPTQSRKQWTVKVLDNINEESSIRRKTTMGQGK